MKCNHRKIANHNGSDIEAKAEEKGFNDFKAVYLFECGIVENPEQDSTPEKKRYHK